MVLSHVDDSKIYEEPPHSIEGLYQHLNTSKYRQVARGDIALGKELGVGYEQFWSSFCPVCVF